MKAIHFFISRKITTLFLFLVTIAAGIFSYSTIPSSLLPDLETRGITIVIHYPGQSPYKIEEIITKPIENAISTIGGIEQIVSSSEDNQARIYLYFEHDVDIQFKSYEVREKIEPVRASFPRDVNEPEVYLHSNEYSPVIILSLTGHSCSLNQLRDIAEKNIKKQIERIDGVSRIEIGGGSKREITIICDNNYMVAHSISLPHIVQTMQNNNFITPIGMLYNTFCDYSILLQSKFSSVNDILLQPVVIPSSRSIIPLSHFATISNFAEDKDSIARYNGSEHISIYIYKSSIANPLNVSQSILSLLQDMHLPDVQIKIIYNEADEIQKILSNLYVSCLFSIALTIIVLYAFLKSARNALPAIIAIPFSLMGIGVYLYVHNSSLNIITLSGIAIAIGMVVDNSIILIEHITQSTTTIDTLSVVQSTVKISKALLASSLTTIAVFIPCILLKHKSTVTYIELAGVVISGIIGSFIVAVIFVPWLFVHSTAIPIKIKCFRTAYQSVKTYIQKKNSIITTFVAYYKKIHIKDTYCTILHYAFTHRKSFLVIITYLVLSAIIPVTHLHFEHFSFTQQNKVFARLELPSGSSLAATAESSAIIEAQCKQLPYIADYTARIEPSHADFIFTLNDSSSTPLLQSCIQAPHDSSLLFTQNSGEIKNEITIVIKGSDVTIIRSIAKNLAEKLLSTAHVKDIVYHFKEERPEIALEFDRIKCAELTIPVAFAGNYIRSALYGPVISKYIENGEIDIRVRSKQPLDIEHDIATIQLPLHNKTIALKEIATIKPSSIITTLWHYDKMRAETISIVPHDNSQQKFEEQLQHCITTMHIPDGYYIEFGKTYIEQKKTKYYIVAYIIIAVAVTYLVLGAIFESVLLPLIVMASIPFSWICALWAVFVSGVSFNIATALGCIVLTGTVVNNSILLLDSYSNTLINKRAPLSLNDYIMLSLQRFRPMLMTTVTTVAGLVPLLFTGGGSNLWQGFAISLIAGLSGTLAIIMIITPVMFHGAYGNRKG